MSIHIARLLTFNLTAEESSFGKGRAKCGAPLLVSAFSLSLWLALGAGADSAEFVGDKACATCHTPFAQSQAKTAMALTWRGAETAFLPKPFHVERKSPDSAGMTFEVQRLDGKLEVSAGKNPGTKVVLPVKVVMGGRRHGLSFLASIDQLDGIALARPTLVEARFAWNTTLGQLVLSPGFPEQEPGTLEAALGVALSPTLEKKCVTCHGEPGPFASGATGGVHCESCHGAAGDHLRAVGRGKPREGIINPARLDADARMAVCAQCHTGFSRQSDPLPDDLLVSNQVNALSASECFIQSGKRVGCTSCHDPHSDSTAVPIASVTTCVGCHSSASQTHAATCPVNARGECIGCHMPSIQKGSFHMVDHWIRVHPEQGVKSVTAKSIQATFPPLREFVRVISTTGREEADAASARLFKGEPFFQVARDLSKDPSAPVGGYLGAVWLAELDPKLAQAAASLSFGQVSKPVDMGGHWIIVQRLPRDFKYEAGQLHDQAAAMRLKGDVKGSLEKYQQALILYPNFLRALIGMGTAFVESGDIAKGAGVLNYAVQTYPEDAEAQFNFGITLGGLGRHAEELAAYRRALELDPDLDAAYENLGAALSVSGDSQGAMDTFRKGLQIDPLSAVLNYDLSLVLGQAGDAAGAQRAFALATKIDPAIANRRKN